MCLVHCRVLPHLCRRNRRIEFVENASLEWQRDISYVFWEHMPKKAWSVCRMANTAATRPQKGIVARQVWCKISLFSLMFWDLLQVCCAFTPVHGWNPAPVDRYIYSLECCWQRFIHPKGCKISTVNPVSWETKRNNEAQHELNVSTNSQRKICTNDPYFAAEMQKHVRKGSRNMLWITHLQKSDNSGLEFGGSLHLEPKSHQRVVAHITIVIVLLCYSVFVRCAWRQGPPWWQSCIAILRIKLPTNAHKHLLLFSEFWSPFCPMQGCTELLSWTRKKSMLHVVFLRWFM